MSFRRVTRRVGGETSSRIESLPDTLSVPRGATLSVGRLAHLNDLAMDSPHAPLLLSRRHAFLVAGEDGQVCVRDRSSVNGTYVNNVIIPADTLVRLHPNDVVAFGGPTFFASPDAPEQHILNPFRYVYQPAGARPAAARPPPPATATTPLMSPPTRSPADGPRGALARMSDETLYAVSVASLSANLRLFVAPLRPAAPEPVPARHHTRSVSKGLKREREVEVSTGTLDPELAEQMTCAVCRELYQNPYSVGGCGHTFCFDCITRSFAAVGHKCPECRGATNTLTPCRIGRFLLEKHVSPSLSPEERRRRATAIREVGEASVKRAEQLQAHLTTLSRTMLEIKRRHLVTQMP